MTTLPFFRFCHAGRAQGRNKLCGCLSQGRKTERLLYVRSSGPCAFTQTQNAIISYFLLQSCLFAGVISLNPVSLNQLSAVKQPFEDQVPSDLKNGSKIKKNLINNTGETDDDDTDIDNHKILSPLGRSVKWSHCLGRYFFKVYCRKATLACLPLTHGALPKCKKNYVNMFGKNDRPCRVVKSCTCA